MIGLDVSSGPLSLGLWVTLIIPIIIVIVAVVLIITLRPPRH